jgi:long-subunit acyl-CoA synthetase (AMP-forming)
MLYTSGTTGRPKGVVTSHAAVAATLGALEQRGAGGATIGCCTCCRCTTPTA